MLLIFSRVNSALLAIKLRGKPTEGGLVRYPVWIPVADILPRVH